MYHIALPNYAIIPLLTSTFPDKGPSTDAVDHEGSVSPAKLLVEVGGLLNVPAMAELYFTPMTPTDATTATEATTDPTMAPSRDDVPPILASMASTLNFP